MTDAQKRTYRAMAFMFIGIAAAFGLVALGELVFRFDFFSGNVTPMALFLGVIGALLLQTVRQSETVEPDEVQLEPDDAEPDFISDAYKPNPYEPDIYKPDLERPSDYSKDHPKN